MENIIFSTPVKDDEHLLNPVFARKARRRRVGLDLGMTKLIVLTANGGGGGCVHEKKKPKPRLNDSQVYSLALGSARLDSLVDSNFDSSTAKLRSGTSKSRLLLDTQARMQ